MFKFFVYNKNNLMIHTILFLIILFSSSLITYFLSFYDVENDVFNKTFRIIGIITEIYFAYIVIGYLFIFIRFLIRSKTDKKLKNQLKEEKTFKLIISNSVGAGYAFALGIISHNMLYFNKSIFFLFLEIIYISTALIKIYLVSSVTEFKKREKKIDYYILAYSVSVALSLLACSIFVYLKLGTFTKNASLIVLFAIYTLYALISAIVSLVKAFKDDKEIRMRFFLVKIVSVLFSLYTLIVSIVNMIDKKEELFQRVTLILGVIISAIMLVEGIIIFISD